MTMKLSITFLLLTLFVMESSSQPLKKSESVPINGTTIYYEVYGKGEPLFLLHGFFQSSKIWEPFVADYANDYEVYLVDLTGHGKSGEFNKTLSLKSVGNDLNALIKHLKLSRVQLIGFSYGGEVAFQLALINPGVLKSMIVMGSCASWDATKHPDWIERFSYKNIEKEKWIRDHHSSESQVKAILDQFPNYVVTVTDKELKTIKTKTLIVMGDQDKTISMDCLATLKENLSNSYLWVLPNTGHVAYEGDNKADFIRKSKEFFAGKWEK